jgi:hypothetical protein
MFGVVCCGAAACEDKAERHGTEPASASAIASALGVDAAALGTPLVDPAKPAGDLAQDLATFTTVEACMKQRSNIDPVLGDAIDAIGYDTFVRDACRVLEAAKTKDGKKCDVIDASALRQRCRAVTAMVAGEVEACPLRALGKPDLGRDALCVAAALRSPAMCAGVSRRDRPACEALVGHDAKKCDAIALEEQRTPCVRDATRFLSALPGNAVFATLPTATGTRTLHGEGRADPPQPNVDLDADVGSGVVVAIEGKTTRVTFGNVETSTMPRAVQPLEHTRFALAFSTGEKGTNVTGATLVVTGATQATCLADRCTLTLKLNKLEPKRGGVLELTVDGVMGAAPQAFRVHAEVTTFVRDVVDVIAARR